MPISPLSVQTQPQQTDPASSRLQYMLGSPMRKAKSRKAEYVLTSTAGGRGQAEPVSSASESCRNRCTVASG
jgi:hypothetical protein